MPHLLITTVGTSLLTNADGRPWGGWNARRPDPLPEAAAVDQWLQQADPVAASAETNTLHSIGLEASDRVLLLHSATSEGIFCAERLQTYLESGLCREAVLQPITGLSYHTGSFAQRGLRSLVSEAIAAVKQAAQLGLESILCATGGFKAEIAFLNLLGALLQVEVVYIHEQFREIVRLPRLPLVWDADFVVRNLDFFEWIEGDHRSSVEVENRLKGRPELRPLIQDDEDGHTYLNAAGDLLFRAAQQQLATKPRAVWPEASPLSPKEKYGLSGVEHHRPPGWERFVDRLCAIDCVTRVTYDAATKERPRVKILDAANGRIGIRYESAGRTLPLAVSTTARGEAQTELVAAYLRRR